MINIKKVNQTALILFGFWLRYIKKTENIENRQIKSLLVQRETVVY